MVLLKWPIGGPSGILTKSGKSLKTVDATHPHLMMMPLPQRAPLGIEHKCSSWASVFPALRDS
jgi:hypothetical protein